MKKNVIDVLKAVAEIAETTAEQVMELEKDNKDQYAIAQDMRNDYMKLHDKIRDPEFDGTLTRDDYSKLAIAAFVSVNQLKNRMATLRLAIKGYEDNLIPKLSKILNESKTDEEAQEIAASILTFDDNE